MLRPKYKKELPKKLKPFQNFLGKNKFLAGEEVSLFNWLLYSQTARSNYNFNSTKNNACENETS